MNTYSDSRCSELTLGNSPVHTVFIQIEVHALIDATPSIIKFLTDKMDEIDDFCIKNAQIDDNFEVRV